MTLPIVGGYVADGVNALIPAKAGSALPQTTTTKTAGVSGGMPYRIPTKQQTYQPSAKRQAVQATTSKMKAA
jgi:hypothetical protein